MPVIVHRHDKSSQIVTEEDSMPPIIIIVLVHRHDKSSQIVTEEDSMPPIIIIILIHDGEVARAQLEEDSPFGEGVNFTNMIFCRHDSCQEDACVDQTALSSTQGSVPFGKSFSCGHDSCDECRGFSTATTSSSASVAAVAANRPSDTFDMLRHTNNCGKN